MSGFVSPTFEWCPPALSTAGGEAVELAASAGLVLDPWQVHVLDRVLSEDERGVPVPFEAGVIVPRQNGKGSVLEALSLYWLFVADVPLVLHSAHEFKTAAEAFRRLRTLITGAPQFARRVEKVSTAAGNEGIELTSGQRIKYVARSKGSGRGFTAGKIVLDEAYALDPEEMGALLPTMTTQPAAQVLYTSSAGMGSSEFLRAVRDRGRAGGDPSLCWLEWGGAPLACPEGCDHPLDDEACTLNDRERWAGDNPGVAARRLSLEFIAKERRALPAAVFARERCGVWDEADAGQVSPLTEAAWAACTDAAGTVLGTPVFFGDASNDGRTACIAAAGYGPGGVPHVEVVRYGPGMGWVGEELERLDREHGPDATGLDPKSAAGALEPELDRRGLDIEWFTLMDVVQACQGLLDAVTDGDLTHPDDPLLLSAVRGAARRNVGDGGWAWTRRHSSADICPLVAATGALHLLKTKGSPPDGDGVGIWIV